MSTAEQEARTDGYALGRTREEYERLRGQARGWETATGRLLDEIGLAPGRAAWMPAAAPARRCASWRSGSGRQAACSASTSTHRSAPTPSRCCTRRATASVASRCTTSAARGRWPAAPFDLVYARLLLFHLPERVAVLARLWDAVAPGGHLVVQDYDIGGARVLPMLHSVDEAMRVLVGAFTAVGCDVHAGARLPQMFVRRASATRTAPTSRVASNRSRPAACWSSTRFAACCRPPSSTTSRPRPTRPRR